MTFGQRNIRSIQCRASAGISRLKAGDSKGSDLTLRFSSLSTPIGLVFAGLSDRGVCDVTFDEPSEDAYRVRLVKKASEACRDDHALAAVLAELEAYFAGRLTRFTVPIDLRAATDFTAQVLRATRSIPFGKVCSYAHVARRIHAPGASRAVGRALSRNPLPIIVPCHRVITHDGRMGGFTGGVYAKRVLLRIEGHEFGDRLAVGTGK